MKAIDKACIDSGGKPKIHQVIHRRHVCPIVKEAKHNKALVILCLRGGIIPHHDITVALIVITPYYY